VVADLILTPQPLYLGHLRRGEAVRREVIVSSGRPGERYVVERVEPTSPHVHARLEARTDGPGQRLVVELDRDLALGRFNEQLRLHTTSPREPVLTLPVFGSVEGDVVGLRPRADRAGMAMQTSLADLVARMVAVLEGRPAGCVRVGGLRGSAPALCLARVLERRARPVVVTCASGGEAEAFAADLRFFLGEPPGAGPLGRRVHHLPAREVPPFEALSPARETVAARLEGFYHLVQTSSPIVVTSAEAWIERCLPRAAFADAVTYVVAGEALAPDALAARLVEWG